eukprot:GEMP01059857.1.p1 GENE.GEMP01059857.1~~GEMP01059857.1.p1  ORF type:complete len:421 (-),score=46.68 GEMP01059857.1:45-1307(-)
MAALVRPWPLARPLRCPHALSRRWCSSSSSPVEKVDTQKVLTEISDEGVENFPRFQKPFVDRMWMEVKAGNGGNPAPGATRNYHIMKGPAYAGHGGAVYFKSTLAIDNFVDLPTKPPVRHGGDGYKTHRGLHGKDVVIQVPLGTIIRERIWNGERSPEGRRRYKPKFRYQLLNEGEHHLIAKGGIGGIGPRSFKKNDGRHGTPGQRVRLELELRVMTDICLLGTPNSGKSALLAALSRTITRIGPEAYSTTRPHTGALRYRDGVVYKITDLPGVDEGAKDDRSRGVRILRHTYRARMLIFVVDVTMPDPLKQLEILQEEAYAFDPRNAGKPFIVVGTKCDALHKDALFNLDSLYYRLQARQGGVLCIGTSARFGLGILRLVRSIRSLMEGTLGPASPRFPAKVGHEALPQTEGEVSRIDP